MKTKYLYIKIQVLKFIVIGLFGAYLVYCFGTFFVWQYWVGLALFLLYGLLVAADSFE